MNKAIKIWEVDINSNYWTDDDYNIWKTDDDFYDYHFDEYHGTKDNYELWQQEVADEHYLQEKKGSEIIKETFDDLMETIEMYRHRQ